MNPINNSALRPALLLLLALMLSVGASAASAHCDTMNGPVVNDARRALEAGRAEPVMKWVTPGDEADVRAAFARTLRVRALGGEAQVMADLHFFETVVRLHRQSEGVAFTGLKPATAVTPAVAAADHALETGSVAVLSNLLATRLGEALEARFAEAEAAKADADHNAEAGRAFVAAYVRLTHLAEAVEAALLHASGAQAASTAHDHP